MKFYADRQDVRLPALPEGQYYIYVLENAPAGNVKIGITRHIRRRLQSLSGSNGGGNKIIHIAVSDPTYLYTLERIAHRHFADYRIESTEWFSEISFDEAAAFVGSLFTRPDYARSNRIREEFVRKRGAGRQLVKDSEDIEEEKARLSAGQKKQEKERKPA